MNYLLYYCHKCDLINLEKSCVCENNKLQVLKNEAVMIANSPETGFVIKKI